MSYEDTHCPCGGAKERDTMLCQTCVTDLDGHPSMRVFRNEDAPRDCRRHAALVLCSESRRLGGIRRRAGL